MPICKHNKISGNALYINVDNDAKIQASTFTVTMFAFFKE